MGAVQELVRRAHAGARSCFALIPAAGRSTSYIGGLPELPGGLDWPSWKGAPLSFLAQIDLTDAPAIDWPEWMPREGRLLFFYDAEQSTWGFDPADRGSWLVLYIGSETATVTTMPPQGLSEAARYKRKDVAPTVARSVPSYERVGGYDENLSEAEFDEINDFFSAIEEEAAAGGPLHQLFGWPSPIQGDEMERESQFASNGVDCGDANSDQHPRASELAPGAAEWRLLLQIDSDDETGMMWGDVGRLYFWVRKDDAKRCDFSNAWMVLQCS